MHSKENSTSASVPAMPRGNMTITVDMTRFAALSMFELFSLRRSIHEVNDHLCAILCQPKFTGEDDNYNAAGMLLENVQAWIEAYEQGLVNVATAARPSNTQEAEWRAWLLLSFEAECTDDLATLGVVAAQAVKDVQRAKFAEDCRK